MIQFVIVLTFLIGTAQQLQTVVRCPNQACVDKLHTESLDSATLIRFQVFKAEEFGLVNASKQPLFPPILDEVRS